MLGQEIRVLIDEFQSAGYKFVEFDGSSLASGVYFYKLQAGSFNRVMKTILIN